MEEKIHTLAKMEVLVGALVEGEVDLLLVEQEIHLQQIQFKECRAETPPLVLVQIKELAAEVVLSQLELRARLLAVVLEVVEQDQQ